MKILLASLCLFLVCGLPALRGQALQAESFAEFTQLKYQIAEAEYHETAGNFRKAAKFYQAAKKLSKSRRQTATLQNKMADCLLLAGKIHRAREAYELLLKEYPLFVRYDQAIEKLRQLADCYEQGKGTFLGIKDPHAAVAVYELIIRETPAIHVSISDRYKLVSLLRQLDREEEAANVYLAILKADPSHAETRLHLARLLLRLSSKGDGDGRKLRGAAREAAVFLATVPDSHPDRQEAESILRQAHEIQGARVLQQAKFYMMKTHYRPEAARRYLHDTQRDYADTLAAAEARMLLQQHFPDSAPVVPPPATQP